ncbi:hypothetical protein GGR57DRAFT_388692 [Xylariaceae sp. FL1272]|nr:hypothetical protein GGR57DRAFT_388692 [Xylariaceae sp. FL1272]
MMGWLVVQSATLVRSAACGNSWSLRCAGCDDVCCRTTPHRVVERKVVQSEGCTALEGSVARQLARLKLLGLGQTWDADCDSMGWRRQQLS